MHLLHLDRWVEFPLGPSVVLPHPTMPVHRMMVTHTVNAAEEQLTVLEGIKGTRSGHGNNEHGPGLNRNVSCNKAVSFSYSTTHVTAGACQFQQEGFANLESRVWSAWCI